MTSSMKHASTSPDAISMLIAEHRKVKDLFRQIEKMRAHAGDEDERGEMVQQACNALQIHMQIEEEIFYPALRNTLNENALMDEAEVEHDSVRQIIDQLTSMMPDERLYDAKVTVLGDLMEHHIREEETEMFPTARKSRIDTLTLGKQMLERRAELIEEAAQADVSPVPSSPRHYPMHGNKRATAENMANENQGRN